MHRTFNLHTLINKLLALSLAVLLITGTTLTASAQTICRDSLRPCSCTPPAPGMVAWWTGNNTAEDVQGGNHGTLQNGASFTTKGGKVGATFAFDGVDDYVSAPSQSVPVGNAPRTVEMWVYTEAGSWAENSHTIFEYGAGSPGQAFGLDMHAYPSIQFYAWGDDLYVDAGAPVEGWMHVAATYDGAILRLYVNGVERGSRSYSGGINTATSDVNIGRSAAFGGASYLGLIDEVSIYNHALPGTEINSIYRADSAGKCRYSVSGRITDECGNALRGVTVAVQPLSGAFTREGVTDSLGNYSLNDLPAGGSYVVTPQSPAGSLGRFVPPDSTFINLSANQTAVFYFRPMLPGKCQLPRPIEYLSDLEWVGTPVNAYQPVNRDRSVGNGDGRGNTITLNGVVYGKGLGVHAYSEVTYHLGGQYSSFVSDIGLDDEVWTNDGSVRFIVLADGAEIYNSLEMKYDSPTQTINVNVAGTQELKLIVALENNGDTADHADWANARLVR
jgi:hypothetical protein